MTESFTYALTENGYKPVEIRGEHTGVEVFLEKTNTILNTVICVETKSYKEDFLKALKESYRQKMSDLGFTVHFMTVFFVHSNGPDRIEEMSIAKQAVETSSFVWIYDESEEKLIIYENQAEDFYGLRGIIENSKNIKVPEKESRKSTVKEYFKSLWEGLKKTPRVTLSLVCINVVIFIICTFTGSLLYNIGAVGLSLIDSPLQLYRVITSMFLHADISHIFSNMVLLFAIGEIVERATGKLFFTIIYFFSGIWGVLATFISELITGNYVVMIGASGAVFGILGALLSLVIFKRVKGPRLNVSRIVLIIIFSLYEGFTNANVANWAHVGGVISGFLAGLVFCLVTKNKTDRGYADEN